MPMNSFYITFCRQKKHVLCIRTCLMCTAAIARCGIILMLICECGRQACSSISIWAGVIKDIVMGLYLLPDRLSAQLETVLPRLLQDVPLAVRQSLVSAWWSPRALRGRCWVMAESRKVDWMSRPDYMASSVTRSNSDRIFLVGTPEGAYLCSSSQDHWR
jgi:hypothetical protein